MTKINMNPLVLIFLFISLLFVGCNDKTETKSFQYIPDFTDEVNVKLSKFFQETENYSGRKIAVFDGDGTVLGQTPHYLADECLYLYAKEHPERKPELIEKMKSQSNVSLPYVQNRVHYMSGDSLEFWRNEGYRIFKKYYPNKVFNQMKSLIDALQNNDFEVWVVTASPEAMYQKFLSVELEIPITNIIGVKSVIRKGIITDEIVPPVPQDHGKKQAIETFVQDIPLFVAGNSRGDKEMIEYGSMIQMIVNPDEHIAHDQTESIADYAVKNNWLIVNVEDVPSEDFPSVSSEEYNIRINKSRSVAEEKSITEK